jgi:endo-1,4-beta-xylanase
MMRISVKHVFSVLIISGLFGCSGQGVSQSSGGASAQLGGASTGPTGGSVGTSGSGGSNASSTKSTFGGTLGSGGVTASSGTPTTAGGVPATGGGSAIGGSGATGGVPISGGTTASGGATVAAGGKTAAIGSSPTGGSSNTKTGGSGGGGGTGGSTSATGGTGKGGTSNTGATGNGGSATGGSTGGTSSTKSTCTAATLKEAGNCTGRLIGTALSTKHLQDSSYTSNALEFDYVTPEDEMKWDVTEATRGQFTYSQGDQIVTFAKNNGMKVKGHTLVWYNQLPSWVSNISSASDLRSAMQNHIQKVMQHYGNDVIAWDVVNEAWDDTDPTKLRDSVFSRVLGSSYIDAAFQAARDAGTNAKLFYNDYATDGLSTKSNSVYTMVSDMKSRGIPIDGVGLQMHWRSVGSTLTAADVISNMQRLIDLGLEVVVSEMDVQLCKGGTLSDQQARFHDIVAACLTLPKCTAVTFWGITDKYSWLNSRTDLGCTGTETPRPLLWDDSYNKKPAYTGVMDALLGL